MSDRSAAQGWRFPDRLAYVVSHALPHSSNGYAVRTHEVARALIARGRDAIIDEVKEAGLVGMLQKV